VRNGLLEYGGVVELAYTAVFKRPILSRELWVRTPPPPLIFSLTLAYIPEHLASGKGWANGKEVGLMPLFLTVQIVVPQGTRSV
jgi:hypothetical protein